MKKLFLSLSMIMIAAALVACSKDKGNNAQPANGQYGQYGSTPSDQCANGGYQGYPYQGYQQYGQYGQQYGQQYRPNCIPQNVINGGNPYYFQMNQQVYLGTCDMRYAGRIQICPPSYRCQPAYGSMGVCIRY
ncbi:MAG: hypothetical protein V4596_02410 [Bdellovibrionota bacterium]